MSHNVSLFRVVAGCFDANTLKSTAYIKIGDVPPVACVTFVELLRLWRWGALRQPMAQRSDPADPVRFMRE